MRIAVLCLALLASAPASSQTLTFDANPVPIIDVLIGGRPARLEVVPDAAAHVFIGPRAAARLGVRTVPFPHATVRLGDGDGAIRSRLGLQRVRFASGDEGPRVIVTPIEASASTDGAIGLTAIPFDIATFNLRPTRGDERPITFPLFSERAIVPRIMLAERPVWLQFAFRGPVSVFNRAAAMEFDRAGHITGTGAPTVTPLFLQGLSATVQPVRTELTISGLPLGATGARTNGALLGPMEADDFVVEHSAELPPPTLSLGGDALSHCSSLRIDRPARQFTLHCSIN